MASRLVKGTLLTTSKRSVAATAVSKTAPSNEANPQITKLPNGLTVTSIDDGSAVSTVTLAFKAGSRFEGYENRGVCHALRRAAGLSSKDNTNFGIVRNLQQAGASLSSSQSREVMLYSTQMRRDFLNTEIMDIFVNAVTAPVFKPWEVLDECPQKMALDLNMRCPTTLTRELLHKAAYRNGLGNSIFSPDDMIGKHDSEMLADFFTKHFTTNRCALVGIGVEHQDLLRIAEKIGLESGQGPAQQVATKYFEGQQHLDSSIAHAHVAVAVETAGANSVQEHIATALLQRILGSSPRVKRGLGQGKLFKVINEDRSAVSSIFYPYSDSGLLGAYIVAEPDYAGEAVKNVVKALRSLTISDAEVKAAKKNVISDLAESLMNPAELSYVLGSQSLLSEGIHSLQEMTTLIESIPVAEVKAVAKKVSGSKLSMGATGNLRTIPYLESL